MKYRIVCVNHAPVPGHEHQKDPHTHIVSAGTGNYSSQIEKRWQLAEVINAMDKGEKFFTLGETSGKTAEVEKYHCNKCGGMHIRTKSDHVTDNNLDNLKHCPVPTRDRDDCKAQPDRHHG